MSPPSLASGDCSECVQSTDRKDQFVDIHSNYDADVFGGRLGRSLRIRDVFNDMTSFVTRQLPEPPPERNVGRVFVVVFRAVDTILARPLPVFSPYWRVRGS